MEYDKILANAAATGELGLARRPKRLVSACDCWDWHQPWPRAESAKQPQLQMECQERTCPKRAASLHSKPGAPAIPAQRELSWRPTLDEVVAAVRRVLGGNLSQGLAFGRLDNDGPRPAKSQVKT